MKKLKWIHRWFSLFAGILLILWAASGIILNHRNSVSALSIKRSFLPSDYQYDNWNNAAIRSACHWRGDSILVYGNVGIWLTDHDFRSFEPMMKGLPGGIDPLRTMKIVNTSQHDVYAATQSGLYQLSFGKQDWKKIDVASHDTRVVDLVVKNDTLFVMNRSKIYLIDILNDNKIIKTIDLKPAHNDDGKIGLFRTLWVIHSGEILGFIGKLFVDFLALLLVFLVLTGYVWFFFPRWMKKRKSKGLTSTNQKKWTSFSIRWHNKLGIWLGAFLVVTVLTGIFLRPPLLIAIANSRVAKIPFSVLDQPNTWEDKLRALLFDDETKQWYIGTNEGIYTVNESFSQRPKVVENLPPVSVMGINVFEKLENSNFLIGSFNGLFVWNAESGESFDFLTGKEVEARSSVASPIGKNLISGLIINEGDFLVFDYNKGLLGNEVAMPDKIKATPMPLWNLALEIHTARIFEPFIGPFYLLIIPLLGLITLLILISGIVIYLRPKKKKVLTKALPES
ncbi:MAG TPA: PepSY domain-containing protein [Bacteroidales bacterium]|nr:PepSY domain-containing protein [Bacteroidales bacterium]HQQ12554.1 PepSY domain-containing protein [Bacteroidales bacterium]